MRIKKIDPPKLLYDGAELTIVFQKGENKAVGRLFAEIEGIDPSKDYEVSIKPKMRRRSLDANAYLWVLIGKLGEKLKKSDIEIYMEQLKDNGVFEIIPIRTDAMARWIAIWGSKGIGWVCDDLGECRNTPGYHNVKCYYGSSTYNTKEMARLIDSVVTECKEQGIETLPPDELARMKSMWGGG